jgi:hypothetical protein
LENGLVSWWRGDGNADDSVGPNNGTAQGGVTYVAGKIGQAFEFDGMTGDVVVPASSTLNLSDGYTIALWIKVSTLPPAPSSQSTYIINKWVNSAENKALDINADGTIWSYLYDVTHDRINSSKSLTVGTWHHVAATYDGADEHLYIDGCSRHRFAGGDRRCLEQQRIVDLCT